MSTLLRRPRRIGWIDLFVVALLLLALAEALWAPGRGDTAQPLENRSLWIVLPFAFLWTLPLLAWRWSGVAAGLGVGLALMIEGFVYGPATESTVAFVAVLAASAAIGVFEDRPVAAAGGIGLFVMILVLLVSTADDGGLRASDIFVTAIFAFGPLTAGQIVRDHTRRAAELERRAEDLEQQRREQEVAAVVDERARIARELHDIVAQGVSVMTLQAGAARTLLHVDPERAREPILAIEQAGREALAETRRLLGVLRSDDAPVALAPQPGMARLNGIVESLRGAGGRISVTVEGEPQPLQPGPDLAAYRVIADTLDEGGRMGARSARVTVRWSPARLELSVAGEIDATPIRLEPWLAAMRERLGLYGGTIDYEILADGFHCVRARIPLEASP